MTKPWHHHLLLPFASTLLASLTLPLSTRARTAGPDTFGHTATDSNETALPIVDFLFVDISSTGTPVILFGDDRSSLSDPSDGGIGAPVSLGAPFPFYNQAHTQLVPSSNGYISTLPTEGGEDATNDSSLPVIPSEGGGGRMYPLHDDLVFDPAESSGVFYQYFPESPHPHSLGGVSIFQWNNARFASGPDTTTAFSFQALLFNSGDIFYQYLSVPQTGSSSTTGLQDHTASDGLLYASNTLGTITPNLAIRILRPRDVFTPIVTINSDTGFRALRDLVADAPSGASIFFHPNLNGQTITLTSGPITIDKDVTIDTSTLEDGITISGNRNSRIFEVTTGNTVTLHMLTIADGYSSGNGGAILNQGLHLKAIDCTFRNNSANAQGGAIEVAVGATATFRRCTFVQNTSNRGGAIGHAGPVNVINTTFTKNHAQSVGGAIISSGAQLTIASSTILGNSADSRAGGIDLNTGLSTAFVGNTIVAENQAPSHPDISGAIHTVSGVNFIGNPTGASGLGSEGTQYLTTASNGPILLSPLMCFGGKTHTFHPLADSPAIDPALGDTSSVFPYDARGTGFSRTIDGDSSPGAIVDIGAVEAGPMLMVTSSASAGTGTLRQATIDTTIRGTRILFDSTVFPATSTTLTSQISFDDKSIFVDASNLSAPVKVSGGSTTRAFQVRSNADFAAHSLLITDGNTAGSNLDDGGAIRNAGCTTLINCTVMNSTAVRYGGGIENSNSLSLVDCSISSNNSTAGGGGISNRLSGSALSIKRSTISNNFSTGRGGGVFTGSTEPIPLSLTITESTIDGNTSAISGGGIFQGGTSNFPGGTTVIANTTIADNKASNSGGGIYNLDVLNVSNTTFAGNQAESVHGGGLYNGGGANTTLVHATITQNTANRRGGGFRNQGILSLERSLVAGNTAPTSPNIDGAFTDSNNLTSGNPVLAPLANYGGLTDTMPPLPGSLAIDSATTLPSTPATDQRGLPRPNGPAPDIGAAEAYPLSLATHPSNDGDTIPDILEGPDGAYPHLNPSANDSTTDTDGDGSPDQDEIGNMTDLFNPNDLFKILSLTVTNIHPTTGAITADLTWTTFPSLTYDILCNDSLDFSSATPLNPTPITPTTTTHTESIQLLPNQDYTTIRRN